MSDKRMKEEDLEAKRNKKSKKEKKKKHIFLKIVIILITLIVILAGIIVGYAYSKYSLLNIDKMDKNEIEINEEVKQRNAHRLF